MKKTLKQKSILDIIKAESIFDIKCGDNKENVIEKFENIDFKSRKKKSEELISYGNIEFSFYNSILESIHIEKNKQNTIKIIDFEDFNDSQLNQFLQKNNIDYKKSNDVYYINKGKVSLTLVNGNLEDITILDKELFI